jgi:hypothetical protein
MITYRRGSNEDISRLRQEVAHLDERRRKLLAPLLHPQEMVLGSFYLVYKRCGNPRCRCAKGEKHGPFSYLSLRVEGKTKLTFVRKEDERWVKEQATNYRRYQKLMAQIRQIDQKILQILSQIRDSKVKRYS